MKINKKKGFTIVELVIVIAIIAILAAVLIPTFANIIKTANISADIQMCKNLNTALAADEALNGQHKTAGEAITAARESGYSVDKLTPTTNKFDVLWDSSTDRFVLLDESGAIVYQDEGKATGSVGNVPANKQNLWKIYNSVPAMAEQKYSIYLGGNNATGTVTVNGVGFDAGENTAIETIQYDGSDEGRNVIIKSDSFNTTLEINAPLDTVNHYGDAQEANINSIKETSYHEFGRIKTKIILKQGRVVVENSADVNAIIAFKESDKKVVVDVLNNDTMVYAQDGVEVNGTEPISFNSEDELTEIENAIALFAGGTGEEKSPYRIKSQRHLVNLQKVIQETSTSVYAVLVNDIDCTGVDWTPMSIGSNVTLNLDGKGKKITNLRIDSYLSGPTLGSEGGSGSSCYYQCAFVGKNNGTLNIKDLCFDSCHSQMTNEGVKIHGSSQVAVIVGLNSGSITLDRVEVKNCKVYGGTKLAAYVGMSEKSSSITLYNCAVTDTTIGYDDIYVHHDAGAFAGTICGYSSVNLKIYGYKSVNNTFDHSNLTKYKLFTSVPVNAYNYSGYFSSIPETNKENCWLVYTDGVVLTSASGTKPKIQEIIHDAVEPTAASNKLTVGSTFSYTSGYGVEQSFFGFDGEGYKYSGITKDEAFETAKSYGRNYESLSFTYDEISNTMTVTNNSYVEHNSYMRLAVKHNTNYEGSASNWNASYNTAENKITVSRGSAFVVGILFEISTDNNIDFASDFVDYSKETDIFTIKDPTITQSFMQKLIQLNKNIVSSWSENKFEYNVTAKTMKFNNNLTFSDTNGCILSYLLKVGLDEGFSITGNYVSKNEAEKSITVHDPAVWGDQYKIGSYTYPSRKTILDYAISNGYTISGCGVVFSPANKTITLAESLEGDDRYNLISTAILCGVNIESAFAKYNTTTNTLKVYDYATLKNVIIKDTYTSGLNIEVENDLDCGTDKEGIKFNNATTIDLQGHSITGICTSANGLFYMLISKCPTLTVKSTGARGHINVTASTVFNFVGDISTQESLEKTKLTIDNIDITCNNAGDCYAIKTNVQADGKNLVNKDKVLLEVTNSTVTVSSSSNAYGIYVAIAATRINRYGVNKFENVTFNVSTSGADKNAYCIGGIGSANKLPEVRYEFVNCTFNGEQKDANVSDRVTVTVNDGE